MRYRTAVKTGRTAAIQLAALRRGSFSQYVAMVEHLAYGYIRPLSRRHSAARRSP
jgi:hypothetical protein